MAELTLLKIAVERSARVVTYIILLIYRLINWSDALVTDNWDINLIYGSISVLSQKTLGFIQPTTVTVLR